MVQVLLLTCVQAQLIASRVVNNVELTQELKNDLIWELKQITPKNCKFSIDAND